MSLVDLSYRVSGLFHLEGTLQAPVDQTPTYTITVLVTGLKSGKGRKERQGKEEEEREEKEEKGERE